MKRKILLSFCVIFLQKSVSITSMSTTESLVISSTTENYDKEHEKQNNSIKQPPIITEINISTNISNRFATTLVTSKVKNQNSYSTEATFFIIMPDNAYIAEFIMEIDGKTYRAYVKEKEEAKQIYNQAVKQGTGAAHVAVNTRDSNKFTVSVNLESESKAIFHLIYQELLFRQKGQYELVLNINPGQLVKDLNIQVNINESRPLIFVRSPSLRSGNEIGKNDNKLDPLADIFINNITANVKFSPDLQKQKDYIKEFGTKEENGLSAQFVVQYDVKRDPFGGEILVHDGYFVHFFAPSDLPPLPKQIIFILDTSGSMSGTKLDQVKQAMGKILHELRSEDSLSIVQFGSAIGVWNIVTANYTELYFYNNDTYGKLAPSLGEKNLPASVPASLENIKKSIDIIEKLYTKSSTNIIGGLEVGLYLVNKDPNRKQQPIIVFLTDGQPNIGVSDTDKIIELVVKLNSGANQVPIYSLSFGHGADRNFLEKLSLKNAGFARHIYEGADAALQLQEFYKLISSPLLKNITFKYTNNATEVTKQHYPLIFDGSELVIAGKTDNPNIAIGVECYGISGPVHLTPVFEEPVDALEKLWAYLTVKLLLENREIADNKTETTKKALSLALKYSFVTSLTSLVVVKPNSTNFVNTENAHNNSYYHESGIDKATTSRRGRARARTKSKFNLFLPITSSTDSLPSLPLPWLNNIMNVNGTVTIPNKGTYELGNLGDITNHPKCLNNPLNNSTEGECTLLIECSEIHSFLTDLQVLVKYFCFLNKYLGVCCPKKEIQ